MLDLAQLRDLGMEVTMGSHGIKLQARTWCRWPPQPNARETEARTYNTPEAGLGAEGGAGARFGAEPGPQRRPRYERGGRKARPGARHVP